MHHDELIATLATARYAQLRTFRRDGRAVDTPIWFVLDDHTLVFRTKQGPKTRRILVNANVELWPCDHRGGYPAGSPTIRGEATILAGAAAEVANHALHGRYNWQYNIVPLLRLPGIKNVDHALPWREKLRHATMKTLWPDSAIVEVRLTRRDGGECGIWSPSRATGYQTESASRERSKPVAATRCRRSYFADRSRKIPAGASIIRR